MTIPWISVIAIDVIGSLLTLVIATLCAKFAWQWTQKKREDIFRQYSLLLTFAFVLFAISRSFGHLIKQILLLYDLKEIWQEISPFSGAINSTTFVIIFAFGIYFHRFQRINQEMEQYWHNLESLVAKRTSDLEIINYTLENEISVRKEIEEGLRQSKAMMENVLNSSNPICITSIDFKVLLTNDAYEKIWGYVNEAQEKKCYECRPGPFCHTELCPLTQIVKGKEQIIIESTKNMPDGKKLELIVTARPFKDADGNIIGVVENFQDITERKKAEDALASEREHLAVTLRSIGDGVITTDRNGNILLLNKVAEKMTGWNQEEAFDKPLDTIFKIIDEETRKPRENPVAKVLKTENIVYLANHTILISRDGTERNIADSGAPILNSQSQIVGVVLVFRDITQTIKMEEELLKIKKLESIGVLAGGIAHDFNNILVAILGNIDLAVQNMKPEDNNLRLLLSARNASVRAKKLTLQLLTFSKGGEPIKKTAAIGEIIKESADFVLHGENVACHYHIPENLHLVEIDKGQMSQVIQNLIINAKQAMPQGGIINVTCENIDSLPPTETISIESGGPFIQIAIADNGSGISKNIVDKIFDPFFSTKHGGSGLGLATTHSIIGKHHGHITVQSAPERGTVFTIYLPASSKQLPKKQKKKAIKVEGKRKIMIMDDEQIVRDIAQKMLNYSGFDVVCAENGSEAIQLFTDAKNSNKPIDLIIMDLTIPGGMGGMEAVQEIHNIDPMANVIVSSGYSNDPVMANFTEYGFCGAIIKPYRLKDFMEVIAKVLA